MVLKVKLLQQNDYFFCILNHFSLSTVDQYMDIEWIVNIEIMLLHINICNINIVEIPRYFIQIKVFTS